MRLNNPKLYMALVALVGLAGLAGAGPARAQSYGGSPFIVSTADHGFESRPSGDFTFTDGVSSDSSDQHKKIGVDMAEIGTMVGLGLLGLMEFNSMHDGGSEDVRSFSARVVSSGPTVHTSPAPVPEFGTGVSFGLMAALGAACLVGTRRKRPAAA